MTVCLSGPVAGDPSIVLGMCPDYWDGSAISNLPGHLRKSILNMHQQWSLVRKMVAKIIKKHEHMCACWLFQNPRVPLLKGGAWASFLVKELVP